MTEMMDWFKDQKKMHRKCAYQVNISKFVLVVECIYCKLLWIKAVSQIKLNVFVCFYTLTEET